MSPNTAKIRVQIETFTDPQFGENAYVLWLRDGGPCWIVDPGFPPTPDRIRGHIKQHRLTPDALILTHGHLDHIAGVPEVLAAYKSLSVYIAKEEKAALTDPNENLSAGYGLPVVVGDLATRDLPPGAQLTLDGTTWTVIDVAGHSPGGRAVYCPAEAILIAGDSIIAGSTGRTDFHHSDHDRFMRNLLQNLMTLPDETRIYGGHGPPSTIGEERISNMILGGRFDS